MGVLEPETLFSRKWGFRPCPGSGESFLLQGKACDQLSISGRIVALLLEVRSAS